MKDQNGMATQNRWIVNPDGSYGTTTESVYRYAQEGHSVGKIAALLGFNVCDLSAQKSIRRHAKKLKIIIAKSFTPDHREMSAARFDEICWATRRERDGTSKLSDFEQAAIKWQPKQYCLSDDWRRSDPPPASWSKLYPAGFEWKRICPPGFDSIEWAAILQIPDDMPLEYLIRVQDNARRDLNRKGWALKRRADKMTVSFQDCLNTAVSINYVNSKGNITISKPKAIPYQDEESNELGKGEQSSDYRNTFAEADDRSRYRFDIITESENHKLSIALSDFIERVKAGELTSHKWRIIRENKHPDGPMPPPKPKNTSGHTSSKIYLYFIHPTDRRPAPDPAFLKRFIHWLAEERQRKIHLASLLDVPDPEPIKEPNKPIPSEKPSRLLSGWRLYSEICDERRKRNDLESDTVWIRQPRNETVHSLQTSLEDELDTPQTKHYTTDGAQPGPSGRPLLGICPDTYLLVGGQ
jgi:hypothetical protein